MTKRITFLPILLLFSLWSYGQYCVPSFSSGCSDDHIDNFEIPAINFAHLGTGCSLGAYADYSGDSSLLIVLEAGNTYDWSTTSGWTSQHVKIWVDINGDQIFDETTEEIDYAQSGGGTLTQGEISIPAVFPPGTYRMRIATRWGSGSTPPSDFIPCNTAGYGEAHDYTVQILPPPSCFPPSDLMATITSMTTADISWTASTSSPSNGYEYAVTTSATPPASGTPTANTSVQGVTISQSVVNYLHVRANCGSGDLSSWNSYMFMGPTPGQIGQLETTGNIPIYSCYGYNYSQQLFFANELALALGSDTYITKIRYYYASAPSSGTANWDNWTVYMAQTSKPEFTSTTDWIPAGQLTQVFSGSLTVPAAGNWMEIELDNGFLWDGTSNLVIAIDENIPGYNCTASFGVFDDPNEVGRTLLHYSDSVNADPTSPPTANGWYYTVNTLQLEAIAPPSCFKPTALTMDVATATTADVSWTPTDTETDWIVSWGTPGYTPGDSNEINTGAASTTPNFQITNLSALTSYEFYVQANCGVGDLSLWEGPFAFTTAADCSLYTLSVTTSDGYVCDEGTTILTASAPVDGDAIYWYDAATGGNLLGAGTSFETPYLTQSTVYWASEVVNGGPLPGQAFANPTTFTNSTSNAGLLFTVTNPIVIVDVEVFSTNATGGDITIELRDVNNGNVTLASTTASITGGGTEASPIPQTLTLNFAVPSAGTYRLVKTASTASVGLGYVSAANSNFPYPLGNSGEVTGGSLLSSTSTLQYFFFNWTIYEDVLCESTREEAVATVVTVEAVEASATDTKVDPGNSTTLTAISTNVNYTYAWTWDSTTGGGTGTATGASVSVTPSAHTTYTVTATDTVTGCVATDEIEILVFDTTLCNSLAVTVDDGYVCDEGTTILTATGSGTGDEIYWYDAATGGNLVGRGTSFETPELTQTTSYWASEVMLDVQTLPGQAFVDPLATTKSTSTSNNYGLIFNLTNEISIVDVEVFSTTSAGGDITIELRDINNGNATLATTTVTIPGGGTSADPIPMTVPLNFNNIPPGDYRLLKTSGPAMTTVSSTYNNFPYPLGTSGEITSGSTSTGTTTTYYYFFNWTIEEPILLCESTREEAVATVVTIEAVEASATDTQVIPGNTTTLTATSTNSNYAYEWTWDSATGGGTGTATGASITVAPTAHTTFTVTATDSVTGCVATDEIEILVFDTTLCNSLAVTATTDNYVCDEGTTILTATGSGTGDEIYWYDAATGGNLVGKGANFETPFLTQTTSYWAAEVLEEGGTLSGLGSTQTTSLSNWSSGVYGLVFTLTETITLVDVQVFNTGNAGEIEVVLRDIDNGNNVIATSAPVTIPGGGSTASPIPVTIPLNLQIPPGNYRLLKVITSGSPGLAYIGSGNLNPGFPFPLGTSGEITSSSTETSTASGYEVFFNWTISTAFALCESTREEAVATVVTIEAVEASATDTQVIPGNTTTLTATSTNSNYAYEWTWDSATGGGTGTATGASITVAPTAHTTYTVTATDTVTGCVATDEIEILVFNTALCNTLDIATSAGATVCVGASATLTASASGTGDEIYWYDAATGGNLVGKGTSFETPFLTQTTSYWAAEVLEEGGSTSGQGKPTYSSATSGNSTSGSNWGLIFDAYEAFTIQDVEVYSTGGGGDITIQLQDNTGAMIDEVTVTLPGGGSPTSPVAYTAVLNMNVPAPGTYRLVRTTSNPATVNMIRESSSNTYPYPLGTVGSITSGYLSGTSSTYYWFYNWTVSTAFALCQSDREEVVATVISVDAPIGSEYQAFLGSETLADLDVTGTNLTWYADASGLNQLPDTTALVNGTTYYVSQTVNGCESDFLAITTLKGFVYLDNNWLPYNPSGVSTASDNIYVIDGLTTINVPLNAQDIHVMNDGTLRIEDVLHLHGDLTVDGELIFGSTPSGNGELAAVSATSTITGEVTVEHYMKDRRSYRMVSSAVTTTTSIHDNWQEGATSRSDNPNPGYGTHITGTTVDQTNGFDGTQTGNASMFTIDIQNQVFQAIANTDVNTLTAGDAYLMFIRGDRTLSNIDTPDGHTATTLRARGQLVTGNHMQTFPTTVAGQFVMFGNPYQSAVDINDVFANSVNVNPNQYYVYDVNIGDYGNYVTVNLPAGTNPSGSVANQYLQAGQAAQFATLSNGPTALNFMESDKAPGNYTSNNAGANGLMSSDILNIQLYTAKNFNEGGSVHDGMAILFDAQYSNNITATDAPKAFGFGENIARDHNGTYLSIERREMPVAGEVYSLYTAGYNHQEYVFKIDLEGVTDVMMYLDDNYTGTSTLLQAGVNTYSFEVGDELSQANDRFSIRTESLLNVDDPTSFAGVRLYPNPLNAETFYVHAPMLNGKEVEIRIADISGRQIYNRTLQSTSDRIEVSVNDTLSSGVYLVTIKHAGEFKTYRLIRE